MSDRTHTVIGLAFLCALAVVWLFPRSVLTQLAFLTLLVAAMPSTVLLFGRTLYTAAKLDYVVPNERDGPAYRSDKPLTFWSNVILSVVFFPVMIVGTVLIVKEVIRLAEQL